MPESPSKSTAKPLKWVHPNEVMLLHKQKLKQKALQARIKLPLTKSNNLTESKHSSFGNIIGIKRKNPFIINNDIKRTKPTELCLDQDESTDQTIFKLLHATVQSSSTNAPTSFNNLLCNIQDNNETVEVVKVTGVKWIPIDWSLKTKVRLLSTKCFPYSSKLKLSEEASGLTIFARCLEKSTSANLNESNNAKFHKCCLYWQHPSLPWLQLFPRINKKSTGDNATITPTIKKCLQTAWKDSLCSLFQLIRTKQCAYFYVCANTFTILFRAGGISGHLEMNAVITPTTRGFRHLLKREDIEYEMPLRNKQSDQGYETLDSIINDEEIMEDNNDNDEEVADDKWMQSMGINAEEIKQINYTQAKISHKVECELDNTEKSLVLIKGNEVHSLFNFLLNCKSIVANTGPLTGIPPTLLAPVAFRGATLNSLEVRENKIHVDNICYYSIELTGPVLPEILHNLNVINPIDQNFTATFSHVQSTLPFNNIILEDKEVENEKPQSNKVFRETSLTDCGLNSTILKEFCSPNTITTVECLKYTADSGTYTWS